MFKTSHSLPLSVYVHIPYCIKKCSYCDFNSHAVPNLAEEELSYTQALQRQIEFWKQEFQDGPDFEIQSIFFGGGTPSLFSGDSILKILQSLQSLAKLHPRCEVTLEMNPLAGGKAKMESYLKAGVNRISMGVQSLNDRLLKDLGRVHDANEAIGTLQDLFEVGFSNVSVDLMYGLAKQSLEDLTETLKRVLDYPLLHFSAYSLIIEEKTLFYHEFQKGKLDLPQDELILEQEETMCNLARSYGFSAYEISNYAKDGFECLHNLNYWNYGAFLGIGAGAVGFLPWNYYDAEGAWGTRINNTKLPEDYRRGSNSGKGFKIERICQTIAEFEFLMMGLRKVNGVCEKDFVNLFQRGWNESELQIFHKYREKEFLCLDGDRIFLNKKGMNFSNDILSELLACVK